MIVTAIVLIVVPPIALLAILDVQIGWAYSGIAFLVMGCLTLGGGMHQARTGQPVLSRFSPAHKYHAADPDAIRLTGRLLVFSGLLTEVNGLLEVAHTRSIEVVGTTAVLAIMSTGLITWLARRPAPNQPA